MPHIASRLLVVGATLLAAAAPAGAQPSERRSLSGDAAVYDLAGTVRVVAGAGRDVVVDVARRGRDASRLRIAQGAVRGRDALRVVYPDDDVVYPAIGRSRTRVRVRDDGTFGDGSGGREVEIHAAGRGTEAWADLTVALPAGGRLAVHLLAGDASVTNVDGDLLLDVGQATIATERTRGRLVIDAGSGRVRIADAQGEVNIDAGSGDIDVRDLDARLFRVDGGSGGVTGTNVKAERIDLDLGSGDTRLGRVTSRDVRVDAGSGSVDLDFVADVDDVRIDVGSGAVTLRVPPSLGASLDVDTGSGGIESDVPIRVTRRERDRLIGSLGDGQGRIAIDGGSGKVRILKN